MDEPLAATRRSGLIGTSFLCQIIPQIHGRGIEKISLATSKTGGIHVMYSLDAGFRDAVLAPQLFSARLASLLTRRACRVAVWCVGAETLEREWAAGPLAYSRVPSALDEARKSHPGV